MKLPRRQFLRLAAGAAALPAISRGASAEAYPSRPVRLIAPSTPGSTVDIVARLIGQWLSRRLGQPFIVDNRPGASQNIGVEAAVHAPPDGYTLVVVTAASPINATLYENLSFNFSTDITPVAGVMRVANVMEINPSVPAKSVPEFIAYAKANPDKINMASPGNGSTTHVAGELFKMMTGIKMLHVPYRGSSEALTDLLRGQAQVMFDLLPSSIGHIKAGELRALAVTTTSRSEKLPNIPTVSEFVPGYEVISWQGVGAPKNIPVEIVAKLNAEIKAGLADSDVQAQIANLGGTGLTLSPAEFGKLIADDTDKWAKVIKFANIKPE